MSIQLTSSAFESGGWIPSKYTCDGEDISPPLEWSGTPEGTRSFALIVDDPDAPVGTWDHWVLYNLPAESNALEEGISKTAKSSAGGLRGLNSWRQLGYGGPCPPTGTHRYFFRLYALDAMLDLTFGAAKAQLTAAMAGHVLAQTELMGLYRRQ
jgi:Raf kinase inhibitor-like YbhB/YbcL family protein